ncbi:transporter substrate-binding domain-containing protein [Neorhizobium sp. NPDC001467]|uniref:transporter substrate-binding domain-containing protein n=1 Tax=Neorhizobium sp. NPDC001467 TaxID=3390595 RepID=UPI003D02DC20
MKSILKTVALAALVGVASFGAASAEPIKMGVAAEPYPPFTSPDASGKWIGWEVDLMNAVCAQAKLECVVTPIAWDGLIPALTSKKIDAIMSSMSITDERLKTIDFSDKYYNTPASLAGPKDATFTPDAAGLKDKILAVQVSTIHAEYAQKHFKDTVSEIKEYQTLDEANNDLAAGRVDAVFADAITLDAFLTSEQGKACCDKKGDVADDPAVLGAGIGFGLRKGDTELKDKLNAGIKAIRADGTYEKFSKNYFDFDVYGK